MKCKKRLSKRALNATALKGPHNLKKYRKKVKQTNLERYNETAWAKTKEGRAFLRDFVNSDEFKSKQYKTKKKNKTFNTSQIERELETRLRELFYDLRVQYKSDVYPFACDFYIPSLDLYIEYNGSWTHGGRFFDKNNQEDLELLEQWRKSAETSKFYANAISTWTVRDVLKLETAIKNNLNYIAWFNEEQANDWIELQKKYFVV